MEDMEDEDDEEDEDEMEADEELAGSNLCEPMELPRRTANMLLVSLSSVVL